MSRAAKTDNQQPPSPYSTNLVAPDMTGATSLSITTGGTHDLDVNTDYVVTINTTTGYGILLRGGRKVVLSGSIVVNNPEVWTQRTESASCGLEVQDGAGSTANPIREFFIHDLQVSGPTLTQGFRTSCPLALVSFSDVRVEGIIFEDADHRDGTNGKTINHPDLLQTYGGAREIRIDGFTGYSSYQGLFLKEDNTIVGGPISLRRVDIHATEYADPAGDVVYAGHRMLWNFRGQQMTLHDDTVYIEGSTKNPWQLGTFMWQKHWLSAGSGSGFTAGQVWQTWPSDVDGWTLTSSGAATMQWNASGGRSGGSLDITTQGSGLSTRAIGPVGTYPTALTGGQSMRIYIYLPSGAQAGAYTARLGAYEFNRDGSGSSGSFFEQSIGEVTTLVAGQWNEVIWDGGAVDWAYFRRWHVRVSVASGASAVTVRFDDLALGSYDTGNSVYEYLPSAEGGTATAGATPQAMPTGATNSNAVHPAPISSGTDAIGAWGQLPDSTGLVRFGTPPYGEWVPAV